MDLESSGLWGNRMGVGAFRKWIEDEDLIAGIGLLRARNGDFGGFLLRSKMLLLLLVVEMWQVVVRSPELART